MNCSTFEDGFYVDSNCKSTEFAFPKPISQLRTVHETDDVIEAVEQIYQRSSSYPVIGLDCEWTPCHKKKQKPDVALLQIATRDGFCVLFRTCFMKVVPTPLLKLLADRRIVKVGVGILHDGVHLRDKFPQIRVNSRLDLRHLSRYCNIYSKKESLAALTGALLPFELQKKNILTYKWENELNHEMVLYAALDALAAVLIFDKLLPLLHEQTSEEPFHKTKQLKLIEKYFLDPGSQFFKYLDTKIKSS